MKKKKQFVISVFFVLISILSIAQSEQFELNESLSWLPEVYAGGNVYKHYKYENIEMQNKLYNGVYSLEVRRNKHYRSYPSVFMENIATNLSVKAFSSGFRTISLVEKASMIKHLKTRKDIPAETREKLMDGVTTDSSQGRAVDWLPEIFTLRNGQESFKKMLKAKLFKPTGEKIEGYEIYLLGKQLSLNKEPANWAWFDGDKTLLTSNIVDNLALMIFAKQGSEQTVLDVKENTQFFKKGCSSGILYFSYSNFKAIFDHQYSMLLSEGIPAKELKPTKEFADSSYRYTVETKKWVKKEIICIKEHYFGSSIHARDNEQGENWFKKQVASGRERHKDIDKIEREGSVVYITSIFGGEKLRKHIDLLTGVDSAELSKSKSKKKE